MNLDTLRAAHASLVAKGVCIDPKERAAKRMPERKTRQIRQDRCNAAKVLLRTLNDEQTAHALGVSVSLIAYYRSKGYLRD